MNKTQITEYLTLSRLDKQELIKVILSKNKHIEDLYNEKDKLVDKVDELEEKLKSQQ